MTLSPAAAEVSSAGRPHVRQAAEPFRREFVRCRLAATSAAVLLLLAACNASRASEEAGTHRQDVARAADTGDVSEEDAISMDVIDDDIQLDDVDGDETTNDDAAMRDVTADGTEDTPGPEVDATDSHEPGDASDAGTDDSGVGDVDIVDVTDPPEPIRPPTCNATEFPEFRSPETIDARSDQLMWVHLQGEELPTLLRRFDGRLSAYDRDAETFEFLGSDVRFADLLAASTTPSMRGTILGRVEGTTESRLFHLQREDGVLVLSAAETPPGIGSAEQAAFGQDGRLVTRGPSALRVFDTSAEPFVETECAAERGEGPLLIDAATDGLFAYVAANDFGDVVFARWALDDCDEEPVRSTLFFRREQESVLLNGRDGALAVTLDDQFRAVAFDGELSERIVLDSALRPPPHEEVHALIGVRRPDSAHDELLLNGAVLINVLGEREVRWILGGLPAVGTSGAAFAVVSTGSELIWREPDWEIAGEPLVLAGDASRASWVSPPGDRTFLLRDLRVEGFSSDPILAVSATREPRQRDVESRLSRAGGAFVYNDIRWQADEGRIGWASSGELVWLSHMGEVEAAPADFVTTHPLFLGDVWLSSVRENAEYDGITPAAGSGLNPLDTEQLPSGIDWRVRDADGTARTLRGTTLPRVNEHHFFRDAVNGRLHIVLRRGGEFQLREVGDEAFVEVDGAEPIPAPDDVSLRVLGPPENGEFLVAHDGRVDLYRIADGALRRLATHGDHGQLWVRDLSRYSADGVVLSDASREAWLWLPGAQAPRPLGVSNVVHGSVADVDQDGVLDLVARHAGTTEDLLYYGDCW